MDERSTSRRQALDALERDFGIGGGQVYLLEVIPLVEMAWADEHFQAAERVLVSKYLREQVEWLRAQAGVEVVSERQLDDFVRRFVDQRPPAGLLEALRPLGWSVTLDGQEPAEKAERRQRIVEYCLDIASAAVAFYPYGPHERFEEREKRLLWQLMEDLVGRR